MSLHPPLLFLIFSTLLTCFAGASERPNILWISCEDISPFLGCYGDAVAETPNIDTLASHSLLYRNASSNAPICAPARSTLIMGRYACSTGTMNLRSEVPISVHMKPFPILLREAGYYCANNYKTDYNFAADGIWDANGSEAHWRNRQDRKQPFFFVTNYTHTHEGGTQRMMFVDDLPEERRTEPDQVQVPPYYPDTPGIRSILAHHYDLIKLLDDYVGEVLTELEEDGLADNTIVFFFSDHGSGIPRHKRHLNETGIQVPLLVHIPEKFREMAAAEPGSELDDLVSFVDFAPTVLAMAGVPKADYMQGNAFLGEPGLSEQKGSDYRFAFRDRADDLEDLSRRIRDGRYVYIRNFMPWRPYMRPALIFPTDLGMFQDLWRSYENGTLSDAGRDMFLRKPSEELYDLEQDPLELVNLANDPDYADIEQRLKNRLFAQIADVCDLAFLPEGEMMRRGSHSSVADMAMDTRKYVVERVLDVADRMSREVPERNEVEKLAGSELMEDRYWAANGYLNLALSDSPLEVGSPLELLLKDENPSVATVAAEAVLAIDGSREDAIRRLLHFANIYLETEPTLALRATRALAETGTLPSWCFDEILQLRTAVDGDIGQGYRNWSYPMFIGFSLDQILLNNGIEYKSQN